MAPREVDALELRCELGVEAKLIGSHPRNPVFTKDGHEDGRPYFTATSCSISAFSFA